MDDAERKQNQRAILRATLRKFFGPFLKTIADKVGPLRAEYPDVDDAAQRLDVRLPSKKLD